MFWSLTNVCREQNVLWPEVLKSGAGRLKCHEEQCSTEEMCLASVPDGAGDVYMHVHVVGASFSSAKFGHHTTRY